MVGTDVGNKLFLKEPLANVILLDYISSDSWEMQSCDIFCQITFDYVSK